MCLPAIGRHRLAEGKPAKAGFKKAVIGVILVICVHTIAQMCEQTTTDRVLQTAVRVVLFTASFYFFNHFTGVFGGNAIGIFINGHFVVFHRFFIFALQHAAFGITVIYIGRLRK
jgi:hypothetical protein